MSYRQRPTLKPWYGLCIAISILVLCWQGARIAAQRPAQPLNETEPRSPVATSLYSSVGNPLPGNNHSALPFMRPAMALPGELDYTFNGTGILRDGFGHGEDYGYGILVQSDGKIIVVGKGSFGTGTAFGLARYNSNGSLDVSFNGDGKQITTFGFYSEARAAALQMDGKLVVVGSTGTSQTSFAIARYNRDGSLDASFDGDGMVTSTFYTGFDFTFDIATAVALQPDGKIVVAGQSRLVAQQNRFAVLRFLSDGRPDASFGTGGKLITSIGLSNDDSATAMALQPDGKIVVAGYSRIGGDEQFAVLRYNPDGSLDASFDGDGIATTAIAHHDRVYALALQPDGRIVVAGESYNGSRRDFAVVRYLSNGSLDSSFDGDGKLTTAFGSRDSLATSLVLQPNGKITVAGYSYNGANNDFALARYNSNGGLDTSFDGDGKLTTDMDTADNLAFAVALQTDGKLLAAGYRVKSNADFAVARYNSDGSLDLSFDGDGQQDSDISDTAVQFNSVAVQPDGKIVVAGICGIDEKADFAVARYNRDGSQDKSFANNGKLTTDFGGSTDYAFALALQPDGKIIVAGRSRIGSADDFAIARYNKDGSLDPSFDADGKLTTDFDSSYDGAFTVALQSDGRIVVAGYSFFFDRRRFAIARYNTDGSLDTNFGNNGKVTTFIAGVDNAIYAIAIQPDGKIVTTGYTDPSFATYDHDFAVARYLSDGQLDNSFGTGGRLTATFGSTNEEATGIALQSDGKIIVVGYTADGLNLNYAIARFNGNGSFDTGFGNNGKLTTDFGSSYDAALAVKLQPNGKIIVAGYRIFVDNYSQNSDFAIAKYNSNGSLDAEWGVGGKVILDFGWRDIVNALDLQPDGKLIIAGSTSELGGIARLQSDSCPNIVITPISLPSGELGQVYSQTLTQSGGGAPFTWSLVSGGLPNNLALNIHSGQISGTPTTSGDYSFSIRVSDANGCTAQQTYTLSIACLSLTPITLSGGTAGEAYGQTLSQTGGNGAITWNLLAGLLPSGLSLNTNTGVLSGIPTMAGSYTFTIQARDAKGCAGIRQYTVVINQALPGGQQPGSVLIYNLFTSSAANPQQQNTRLSLSNTHPQLTAYVHLFFVDGDSCNVADNFLCLTANQTVSFQAADFDPGTSGYVIAVTTNRTGCPVNFNYLIGDEYVKLVSGHAANLGAVAIPAITDSLPACSTNSNTSTLAFDGINYSQLPHVVAVDNLASRVDGNDTLLIVNRLSGNLATGAAKLTDVFGLLYNDAENGVSFSFSPGACQVRGHFNSEQPPPRRRWLPCTGLKSSYGAGTSYPLSPATRRR